jgi:hypothetical protein
MNDPRQKYNISRLLAETIIVAICGAILFFVYKSPPRHPSSSFNSAAYADLRNAATAQDAYFQDHGTYADSTEELTGSSYGFYRFKDVVIRVISADEKQYEMESFHIASYIRYHLTGPEGRVIREKKSMAGKFYLSIESLVYDLEDEDADYRIRVAYTLGKLKDPACIEPLIKSVRTDKDIEVRRAAAEALKKIGWQKD